MIPTSAGSPPSPSLDPTDEMTPAAPVDRRSGGLVRDAAVTVGSRVVLAVLIFGTDIVLARLLGPSAKGRFAIVLLYSQLVALVLGWGMDQALAVASGRSLRSARAGFANAVLWTAVVGGFGLVVSAWAYGLGKPGPPDGPLVSLLPHLSARQFLYSAIAVPGELFFAIALFALLGRRLIASYAAARILRRLTLLVLLVGAAAVARLSLEVALAMNLVALALTALLIVAIARRHGFLSVRPSRALLVEQMAFGTRAVPGALAERLQFRADSFLVNLLLGVKWTGIYSVTSGLAETLWYIPNALGIVMFSRAVDPATDSGRVAAALTRATVLVAAVSAIPAAVLGPSLVRLVYGSTFADAGVALRYILPGIVAYSIVAVLTRYLSGQGHPGTTTLIMALGLGLNLLANLFLIPRLGINGAGLSSSISYTATAVLALMVFLRVSGRGLGETLVPRWSDFRAVALLVHSLRQPRAVRPGSRSEELEPIVDLVVGEVELGAEE
jgi:O-antigen/teichoic acid export membrane protein